MNDIVSGRKVVVALAGVMCRGARWGIHLPWALLHARVIVPLRAQNVDVEVWGFNNIPPSIDGCSVPADGGKSLFGDLDYYEAYKQRDIDDSPEVAQIHRLLETVGLAGRSYSTNIGRVLFVEGEVCGLLKEGLRSGHLPADTVAYIISPDLLYYEAELTRPVWDPNPDTLWVIGELHHAIERKPEGIENGWMAGRASTLVRFHEARVDLTTNVRATYYENWLWETLRHIPVAHISHSRRAMHVHKMARCLRGYASDTPPWNWRTTSAVYGACTWQRLPKDMLLQYVEQLANTRGAPGTKALEDARFWLPLERNIMGLVSQQGALVIQAEGSPLREVARASDLGFIVEWCGKNIVRLRCLRTGLFLARCGESTSLTGSQTGNSLTHFACLRTADGWQLEKDNAVLLRPKRACPPMHIRRRYSL